MNVELGRPARRLWTLMDKARFLNHGAYGACPASVQRAQNRIRRRMEAQPDEFFSNMIAPKPVSTPLRAVVRRLGEFVGAAAERIALVENATVGVQSVLQSCALAPGDEILITNHQYNAVRLAVEMRCRETGARARTVQIPLPTTSQDVRGRLLEAAGPRVKLAILDHITSATALIFPIREIVADLRARGVRVAIDGAHAIGQIPLDVCAIDADWYVTNAHKWLFAPKGCALLHAADRVAEITRPPIISHYIHMGFPKSFDFVGTRDYSGWLAIPAAIRFFEALGPERLRRHNAALIATLSQLLAGLGAQPVGPPAMSAAMRAFILPQRRDALEDDAMALKRSLWRDAQIQVNAAVLERRLLIRVCAQAYVDESDCHALSAQLEANGWPGR